MARPPLIHFPGALFHITARGNNKQTIFHNDRDFTRYLSNIKKCKDELRFHLYAFALMPNHLHLLIEVKKFPISKIMQKLQTAFTMYVNKKYSMVGHLFQGRYFSLLVEKDTYLLELIRYIHLNPVRAGIVDNPSEYPWTSHNTYLYADSDFESFVDKDKVLPYFSSNSNKAIHEYKTFIQGGLGKRWEDIACSIHRGNMLGSPKFVRSVEKKLIRLY